jgi:hypothetical protein
MARIFARLSHDVVVELLTERVDITKEWHPDFLANFCVEVTGHVPPVEIGWVRQGGVLAPVPAPVVTPERQMQVAVAAGCAIVSSGTPALSATYDAMGPRWQQMQGELLYIASFAAFSGGLTVLDWPARTGPIEFHATSQFQAVGRAIGDWLTLWQRFVDGAEGAPPTSPVTIA